jgi:hypothetical protein
MVKEVILSFVHFKKDAIPHVTDATAMFFGPNVDNSSYLHVYAWSVQPMSGFCVSFQWCRKQARSLQPARGAEIS